MAFVLKCRTPDMAARGLAAILAKLATSRFTVQETYVQDGIKIVLRDVRLKQSKHYCGNHAGPCLLTWRKHRKANYLEGADWVSFNDMLNDALDAEHVDATGGSGTVQIRQGTRRRTYYGSVSGGEWIKKGERGDYADYCGKAPPETEYPTGTPGIHGYAA